MTDSDSSRVAEARRPEPAASRPEINLTPTTRLDPPHELAGGAAEPAADVAEATDMPALGQANDRPPAPDEPASEQLRLEALQLAVHLRNRQRELDGRQAALNAQLAGFDSDTRAARLWLAEQQSDLAARSETQAAERRELEAQSAALDQPRQDIARRQQKLVDQEATLSQQRQELCEQQADLLQQQQELAERDQEAEGRLKRLAAAEAAAERREQEAAGRLASVEQSAALAERLAGEHAQAMADLKQKRTAVERRAEHVDQCRAALEQLRDELGRMHRETLEIRLTTEELWVQLSGAAPPAALVRSLGQIRTKLAEQYTQANAELARQRQELETIRAELAAQHEKLTEHKRQFDHWAAGRQQDTQEQATRLIAREQQVHQDEVRLREQFAQWQAQRTQHWRQLRQRHRSPAAMAR